MTTAAAWFASYSSPPAIRFDDTPTVRHIDGDRFRCGCGRSFDCSIVFGSECPGGEVDHCSLTYDAGAGENAWFCGCGARLTEAAICIAYLKSEARDGN